MDEKKKKFLEDKKADKSKTNDGFDLVKILQESQKKNNQNNKDTDTKQHNDGDNTKVSNDKSNEITANKLPKIEGRTEKRPDERKEDIEKEIREKIAKENALKIQQQQDDEKMREMQKWMQKMQQNAFKEKIKKEIKEENDAKKDSNNFGSGNSADNVFGKTISAQTDYAKDELSRIKKIEDDLKGLCEDQKIHEAYKNFASTYKNNDDIFADEKKKIANTLDNDIKQLKNELDIPAGTAQFDANELVKSIFAYVGDDLSTNIGGYALICDKIREYKKKYPIQQMEFDAKTGKEKNVLDNDIIEERKKLNTQLETLLNNTDLFSTDDVKAEIIKRYNDISKNNATNAIMTFIYGLIDFLFGTNRYKEKMQLCDLLWRMYHDVGDVQSIEKVKEARKRFLDSYDKYNDLLAYMPTWIFYPELYDIDKNGKKHIKKDILKECIDKVSSESVGGDKIKYISQNLYKIVGGNNFHTLINVVGKKKMDAIIDAISTSDILPVGMNPEVYKKIIRRTIELPPDTGKEKKDEPKKADKIMKELNIQDKQIKAYIEALCNGTMDMNKKDKSGKSSDEKKIFKEAKFLGDKMMIENDIFDAKKDAVKGLIQQVSNALSLNIDKTMSYLCNINSSDIDVGTKTIMDNHKNRLKSMIEAQRTVLLGIVADKFSDDEGVLKKAMEEAKEMVEYVKKNNYCSKEDKDGSEGKDEKKLKVKLGKMTKYNDLDSFDFRDLSDETNTTRKELTDGINKMFDKMLSRIESIDVDVNNEKQKISSMMKEISDGTRKDYKEIEMEKAKYNTQTMNALLESMKNKNRGGFGMMPVMGVNS